MEDRGVLFRIRSMYIDSGWSILAIQGHLGTEDQGELSQQISAGYKKGIRSLLLILPSGARLFIHERYLFEEMKRQSKAKRILSVLNLSSARLTVPSDLGPIRKQYFEGRDEAVSFLQSKTNGRLGRIAIDTVLLQCFQLLNTFQRLRCTACGAAIEDILVIDGIIRCMACDAGNEIRILVDTHWPGDSVEAVNAPKQEVNRSGT